MILITAVTTALQCHSTAKDTAGTDTILSVHYFFRNLWVNAVHFALVTQYLNIFFPLAIIYLSI